MDKPNFVCCMYKDICQSLPKQHGVQNKICSFFSCRLPSVQPPKPTGMQLYNPVQQKLDQFPGDFIALRKGWKTGVQQETENMIIAICFSWLNTHYLLVQILLKLLSKCTYWICLHEPSVFFQLKESCFFQLKESCFPSRQWMCQYVSYELNITIAWKWWLKFSVLVKLRCQRCLVKGFGHTIADGNGIQRCTVLFIKLDLYAVILLLTKRGCLVSKWLWTICRGKTCFILVEDRFVLVHISLPRFFM